MTAVADLSTLELLHRLPEQALLTTAEAAVFLRTSVRSLERMRQPGGGGPVFVQGGAKGTVGSNQKCLYMKSDLLAWVESLKVSDNIEAAVRKGQLFRTVLDVAEENPYWLDEEGRVAGSVWETSVDVFFARIQSPLWSVEWMSASEACVRPWAGFMAKRALAGAVERVLTDALGAIRASAERDEFEAVALDGEERERRF